MQKGAPPHGLWASAASLLPGAPPQLHSSRARPLGLRVVGIFVHFFFIRRVAVVVKREALAAEGRQERAGGIAAAQPRGWRAHRHRRRLQPLPAGVRRERGGGARGRPRPGAAVCREPGVGRGPSRPPPPRRPHRARRVQTGGAAAETVLSQQAPRAPSLANQGGNRPALPGRRVDSAPALFRPPGGESSARACVAGPSCARPTCRPGKRASASGQIASP